jgi:hypothetical protein
MTDTPAPKDAPRDFFISYATPDGAWAEWVAWILEENGYTVHLQAWDFLPGKNFALEMQKGATECDRTIAILSDNYLAADFTQSEWAAAFSQDPQSQASRLISIRVSDCKPTGLLKPIISIDIVGKAEADAERSILEGIAAALKKRGKPEVRPGFPSPHQVKASAPQNLAAQDREDLLSRFDLFRVLSALTAPELSQLVFVLKPPAGVMPSEAAPGGDRVSALLNWAESSTGRGLGEIQSLLRKILPATEHQVADSVFPGRVQTQNPFLPLTGAVDEAAQFFDCDRTLNRIFEMLNSGSNVALIGDRNLGKSSLLREVARQAEGRLTPPRKPIFINLVMLFSEDEFYEELCAKVGIAEDCRGNRLNRALRDMRLLLILDEVERIVQDEFSLRVRDQLRGLSEGRDAPLRLVLAARRSLDKLFPDSYDDGMVSPLHGICIEESIKPWSGESVRQFIATRLAPTPIRFSDNEIAELIATCGGRPKDLMQHCNALFRQKITP